MTTLVAAAVLGSGRQIGETEKHRWHCGGSAIANRHSLLSTHRTSSLLTRAAQRKSDGWFDAACIVTRDELLLRFDLELIVTGGKHRVMVVGAGVEAVRVVYAVSTIHQAPARSCVTRQMLSGKFRGFCASVSNLAQSSIYTTCLVRCSVRPLASCCVLRCAWFCEGTSQVRTSLGQRPLEKLGALTLALPIQLDPCDRDRWGGGECPHPLESVGRSIDDATWPRQNLNGRDGRRPQFASGLHGKQQSDWRLHFPSRLFFFFFSPRN